MQHANPKRSTRRLTALASISALLLGSLALAGCGNDDDMPPMEESAPMEQPAQDPVMGDEPPMDEDPMGDDPMSDDPMSQDPMAEDPMAEDPMAEDPMDSQEPMVDDDLEDEEPGSF